MLGSNGWQVRICAIIRQPLPFEDMGVDHVRPWSEGGDVTNRYLGFLTIVELNRPVYTLGPILQIDQSKALG